MNLTQPPFDSLQVREAMNFVMDKHALVQAWGGPVIGDVANHIIPDSLLNNLLADYAPYKTPGDQGSVAKAKAAMKGSKYDTDKNGTCSAKECKNVLLIVDTRAVDTKMLPVIVAEREEDRHHLRGADGRGCVPDASRTRRRTSRSPSAPAGVRTTPMPYTFFSPLFDGRTIIPNGQHELLARRHHARDGEEGRRQGQRGQRAERQRGPRPCANLVGAAHTACYAQLDKKLMTQVVPWVPYLWSKVTRITSKNVTKYEFDQFATTPAYAHMAVK